MQAVQGGRFYLWRLFSEGLQFAEISLPFGS